MKPPVFKNYINWRAYNNNCFQVAKWARDRFNHEIVIDIEKEENIDLRDVGDITLGPWTAYGSVTSDIGYYFFEEEADVNLATFVDLQNI